MCLVYSWIHSDLPMEEFGVKAKVRAFVEDYYNSPFSGCQGNVFQVKADNEMCWGGYILIGAGSATVLIICVVIGVS